MEINFVNLHRPLLPVKLTRLYPFNSIKVQFELGVSRAVDTGLPFQFHKGTI